MTKVQRSQYEMFLQSRDFLTAHPALLGQSSGSSELLAQLTEAIAQIERQGSARLTHRDAGHDTPAARAALKRWMLDIAFVSRDLAHKGLVGVTPLRVPDKANDALMLETARQMLTAAAGFSDTLVQRGLGEQWAENYKQAIDAFAARREERRVGRNAATTARSAIAAAFKSGAAALHSLDGIVDIALRREPVLRPTWEQCRRVVGGGSRKPSLTPADLAGPAQEGELEKAS